ncbi:MAG TPA: hypothetical protein VM597_36260 [Gemmataceae bacterium]|jgi:hypothetical protein|nr:hypothetical protein [Gemmataceae bacterium]
MFRSLLNGRRTGKRNLKTGLGVEQLADRLVPATFSFDGATNTAFVTGELFGSDAITILHHGDGTVTASDELGNTRNFAGVDRIVVKTHGGSDVVRYKLDGTLTRDMRIDVDLDEVLEEVANSGNDRFTGTLNADISNFNRLEVNVYGGYGDDLITMYGTPTAPARAGDSLTDGLAINDNGLRIGVGSELDLALRGGLGNDRIFADYQGELDGLLNLEANGQEGDDVVSAVVRLQAGSTGQVGTSTTPARVTGFWGTDSLRFHVFDNSGNGRPVFAQINGGEDPFVSLETDVGSRTANVAHAGGVEDLDTL